MAYFFRLIIKRLIQILIGFVIGFLFVQFNNAHADYTPPVIYKAKSPFTGEWSTMQAACDGTAPQHATSLNRTFVNVTYCQMSSINGLVSYNFTTTNGSNQQVNADTFLKTQTCAEGQTIVGGSAANGNLICSGNPPPPTCNPPQVLNQAGTACETPNPCLPKLGQKTQYSLPDDVTTNQCLSGCTVSAVDSVCLEPSTPNQRCYITGYHIGTTCTTPVTETPSTPQLDCVKSGQSYGTVNGTVVCVPKSTAGAAPLKETSSGSKTQTNTNGSTVTSKTSSIQNGTVTTTITTTINGGTPTTETKQQDKGGFCEENPTSKICKDDEKSTFAGSCTSSFTCEGDAITCATAKAVNQQKCDLEKAVTDSKMELQNTTAKPLGDLLNNGQYSTDVQQFIDGNGNSNTVINIPSSLSESGNANYTGAEIQDVSFTVQGQQVNVPLSNANEYFYIFGYILLALAYLSAYKIVTGAI